MTEIFGTCDPQFNPVKDAFSRNFVINEEVGAAVSVYMQGEKVVDLWGGYADERQKVAWQEDTLCAFYSTGKPFVATSLLRQVDAGRIKLDDPVCSVWPEFAAAGKEQITFRQLLCHQSGVVAIGNKLPREAAYDWELMVGEIAAQRPWWEPGSRHVYHTHTFGVASNTCRCRTTCRIVLTTCIAKLTLDCLLRRIVQPQSSHGRARVTSLESLAPPIDAMEIYCLPLTM